MEVPSINDQSPTPVDIEERLPIGTVYIKDEDTVYIKDEDTVYIKDEVQGNYLDSPVESLVNYCQICEHQFESEEQFEKHMCHLMITINTDLANKIDNGLDENVIQYRCNPIIPSSNSKASLSNSNVNQSHNNNTSSNCNQPDFYVIQTNSSDPNQLTKADNSGSNIINPISSTSNGIDSQSQFFDPDDLVLMNRFKICLPKAKKSDMPTLEPIITKPYRCDNCDQDFDTNLSLMRHWKSYKFPCKLCQVKFCKKETLINHMREHKDIGLRGVVSDKLLTLKKQWADDESGKDGIETPVNSNGIDKNRYMSKNGCLFFCNICSRHYSYERNLVRHLVDAHAIPLRNKVDKSVENSPGHSNETEDLAKSNTLTEDNESSSFYKYKCKYCTKILSTQFSIWKHIKSVHKISQMYACKQCNTTFQAFSDIQDHVLTHLLESEMEPINFINCITLPYVVMNKGEVVKYMKLVTNTRQIKSKPLQNQSIPLTNQSIPLQNQPIPLQSKSTSLVIKSISSQNESIPGPNQSIPLQSKSTPLVIKSISSQNQSIPLQSKSRPLLIKSISSQNQSIPLQSKSTPLLIKSISSQNQSIPLQSKSTPLLIKSISSQNQSIPLQSESTPLLINLLSSQNKSIPGPNQSISIANKIVPLHIKPIPSQLPDASVPNTKTEKKIFLITIKSNSELSMLNQSQTTQSIPFDNSQLTSEIHIKNEPDDGPFDGGSIPSSSSNANEQIQIKTEFNENNPITSIASNAIEQIDIKTENNLNDLKYSIDIENIPINLADQGEKGVIDASNGIDSNVQIGTSWKFINATAVPEDVKILLAKKQSELCNGIDKNVGQSRIDKSKSNSNGIDSNGKNISNTNLNESDSTTRTLVNDLLKHCNVIDTIENTSKPITIDHLNQTELKQNGMNAKIIAVWDNITMDSSGNPIKPKIGLLCTICNINFFDNNKLAEHMKMHDIVCTICNLNFQRKHNLKLHMQTHELVHRCMICGERFSNLSKYNTHLRTHSTTTQMLKCAGCNQNFSSKRSLTQHHRQLPDHAIGSFKCDVCDEVFRDEQQMSNHLRVHLDSYAHACSLCGQRFERKRNLRKHLREHESERFTCTICGEHFTEELALKRHKATHLKDNRFMCHICNNEFKYSHTLRTHLLTHYKPITRNAIDTNPSKAKKLKLIPIDATTENAAPSSQSNGIESVDDEFNIIETTAPDIIEIDDSDDNGEDVNENCTITSSHSKSQPQINGVDSNTKRIVIGKLKNKLIKCYNSKKLSTRNSINKRNAIDTRRNKTNKQQLISNEINIIECNGIDTTDSSSITRNVNDTTVAEEAIPVNMYQNNAFIENNGIDQTQKNQFVLNSDGIENEGTVVEPAIPVNIYENNAIAQNNGVDPIESNIHKCTKFEFNSENEDNGIENASNEIENDVDEIENDVDEIENPVDIETNLDNRTEITPDDKTLICKICKEEFSGKKALDKHVLVHFEKSKYICRLCNERFQTKANFTVHSNKHCGRYVCTLCSEGFRIFSDLSLHLKAYHINDEEYKCYVCDEIFTCGYDLHLHRVTIHNRTNRRSLEWVRYNCDICQENFWNNITLNAHMITHLSPNDKFTCMFCDWTVKDSVEFELHLRLHTLDNIDEPEDHLYMDDNHEKNDQELPYICELCNAGFTEKRYLDRHIMTHVMKSYKCTQCPMSYSNQLKLRAHIRNEHKFERISNCSICREKFMYHYQLDSHMEKIHNKKINKSSSTTPRIFDNFCCLYCSKTHSCECELRNHLQIILDAKYWVCRVCNQQFGFKHSLRYHMLKKHTSNLSCTMCTKVFMNKQTLAFHMRIHSGRNTHRCEPCQMSFQCSGVWNKHRREHQKNRFRCELCDGTYNNVALLRAHLQTIHLDLDQFESNENGIDSTQSSIECPESNTVPTDDEIDIKENIVHVKCETQFETDN